MGIYVYVVLPLAALVLGALAALLTVTVTVIGGAFALLFFAPAMYLIQEGDMKYLLRGPLRILAALFCGSLVAAVVLGIISWATETINRFDSALAVPYLPIEVMLSIGLIAGILVGIREYYGSLAEMKFGNLAGLVLNGAALWLFVAGAVWNHTHGFPTERLNGFLYAVLAYPVALVVVAVAATFTMFKKQRGARWTGHTA